jgi:hypothetical protein
MWVEFVVAAGKREQARCHAQVDDSGLVSAATGPPPREADVVLTLTPADAEAVRDGALDLSVGFMRGQVKMAGDFGALLRLLPLTHGRDARVRPDELLAL